MQNVQAGGHALDLGDLGQQRRTDASSGDNLLRTRMLPLLASRRNLTVNAGALALFCGEADVGEGM